MLWYVREASVATYVANLPAVWPLLRHIFPCLRGASQHKSSGPSRYYDEEAHSRHHTRKTGNNTVIDAIDLDDRALFSKDPIAVEMEKGQGITVLSEVKIVKEREGV